MAAGIHDDGAADAEVGPEEAAGAAIDKFSGGEDGELDFLRRAGEIGVEHGRGKDQWDECGVGWGDGMAELAQEFPA